jgi:hypothetical protein
VKVAPLPHRWQPLTAEGPSSSGSRLPAGGSSSSSSSEAAAAVAAGTAAAIAAAKVCPEPCLLLSSRPRDICAELALQLEYTAGMKFSLSVL